MIITWCVLSCCTHNISCLQKKNEEAVKRSIVVSKLFYKSHHSYSLLRHGHSLFPKRVRHKVRSNSSSFNFQYLLVSVRSFSSCSRLFLRLPATSIFSFIFPLITCLIKQFLRKMWPVQLSFRYCIVRRMSICSLTLCNTSFLIRSVQMIFFTLLQHHILKPSWYFRFTFPDVQVPTP